MNVDSLVVESGVVLTSCVGCLGQDRHDMEARCRGGEGEGGSKGRGVFLHSGQECGMEDIDSDDDSEDEVFKFLCGENGEDEDEDKDEDEGDE